MVFKKHSEESKEKIRLAMLGQQHTLGLKHSEETKLKMSLVKKGKAPKNINELMEKGKLTRFKKGHKINIGNKHFSGKKVSEETKLKISIKNKGRKHTEEELKKISETSKGRPAWNKDICGEESSSWKGGLSFQPYTSEFNRQFKKIIKIRDAYVCQKCNMLEEDSKKLLGHSLHVHHIDYDKKLSIKENCITLCPRCHGETTSNREAWTSFYQIMLHNKYGYIYEKNQIVLNFGDTGLK